MTLTMLAAALLLAAPQDPAPVPPAEPANEHVRARTCDIDAAGERVAVGMQDGRVLVLSAETGAQLAELSAPGPAVPRVVRFSPNGELLACIDHLGELRLWKRGSLEPVATAHAMQEQERPHSADSEPLLLWSPTGARLLALGTGGNASLWNPDGELVRRWVTTAPPGDPQAAWTRDGRTLFLAMGTTVVPFRAEDGRPPPAGDAIPVLACGAAVVAFALSPNGARIATGHDDVRVFTWELATGERTDEDRFADVAFPEPFDDVAALAFSPAGDRFALSTRKGTTVAVKDSTSGERIFTSGYLGAHFSELMQLAWQPDGGALYFSFECGGGPLWRLASNGSFTELGRGFVPRFGAELGVTRINRNLVVLAPDGSRRWRRVERRADDAIEVELLTAEDA